MKFLSIFALFPILSFCINFFEIKVNFENDEELKKRNDHVMQPLTKIFVFYDKSANALFLSTKKNVNHPCCAVGIYKTEIFQTGWNKLKISTFDECDSEMQMFSAGVAEGVLTSNEIADFYHNVNESNKIKGENLTRINDFFEQISKKFMPYLESKQNENNLTFFTISLFENQLKGIYVGANIFSKKISLSQLFTINADGQIGEFFSLLKEDIFKNQTYRYKLKKDLNLNEIFDENNLWKEFNTTDANDVYLKIMEGGRCTALVKLIRDKDQKIEDIIFAHSTWGSYTELLRIYKHYEFDVMKSIQRIKEMNVRGFIQILQKQKMKKLKKKKNENAALKEEKFTISFSSYPGCISSTDDFYLTGNNLAIMETTLEVINRKLWKNVLPLNNYIPDFLRVMTSNLLAKSGKEWFDIFIQTSTGTYNSQWMIIDLNKGKNSIGKENLIDETFYIGEQIPGRLIIQDFTKHLNKTGYWGSYNIPYFAFPEDTGFKKMASFSHNFDYHENIRAKIIANNSKSINNIDGLKKLMQFNDWNPKNSEGTVSPRPAESLAARYDLEIMTKQPFGANDLKISNVEKGLKRFAEVISGPLHLNQPVFDFKDFAHYPHNGIPSKFDFDW